MFALKLFFCGFCLFSLTAMGPAGPREAKKENLSPFEIDKLANNQAPDFTLKDIHGSSLSLSSLKGKVVLLNFWATWCPPCKAEMPSFNKLYKEMKPRGFEIIAVSNDNAIRYVKEYLSKNSFDFVILWDENQIVTKKYKIFTVPTTLLIDRNGVIVEKFFGERDWTSPKIKKKIEKLL